MLLATWAIRITAFDSEPWTEAAAIGTIPGLTVAGVVSVFCAGAAVVAARPCTWHAKGELRVEGLRKRH